MVGVEGSWVDKSARFDECSQFDKRSSTSSEPLDQKSPAVAKEDAVGLRIDVEIENKSTGECKWVDTTVVHTVAESYREREFKSVLARNVSTSTASSLSAIDALKFQASPILMERTVAKAEKYSRLLWIAKKQTQQKKRQQAPLFAAFSVSDFGELSPAATELLDWLVDQHRHLCERMGPRSDGCKPLELVREFKRKLKASVQMAVAAGSGEMFHGAGQGSGVELDITLLMLLLSNTIYARNVT